RSGLEWSPDGKWLATGGTNYVVKVWDADKGTLHASLAYSKTEMPFAVAWSPNSRKLAAHGCGGLRVWDMLTQEETLSLSRSEFTGGSLDWNPDGRSLALACDDFTVKVVDPDTGKILRTLANHTSWVRSVRWAKDGKHLASVSFDKTLKIQNATAQDGITTLAGHKQAVWALAWSPNRRKLATAGDDKTLTLWDVAAAKAESTVAGFPRVVRDLAWNPQGTRIAVSSFGGGVQVWDPAGRNLLVSLQGIQH